ncbi:MULTISPECIES: glycine betaine ABC transporter substrate-binding protein [unclassified Microbacterium]|uniref:glycine betaine ABC transporter substrate-binding protein n=1 Tax=unclassified Microbacterium TaxID=2609290 RepID=UPI00097F62A5|nr:glycine betaine ABC transporter substrate-binding protein [Microbacterium sp. JB110]RCS59130.1 glycine/betaine ABC transporter substrate-binding protein [Microbacterium sp. JB110]SJM68953.1 Substrate-binding region of ABC-type glycine betaine transport system [Frigoribacterium sp. JB110]
MNKRIGALALVAASAVALAGCTGGAGAGTETGSQGDELDSLTGVIGSKDFAEQYVLSYITTELFRAHGADVEANIDLVGSSNVRQAFENDEFLGYWDYTGTGWITYLGETEPVQGAEAQFDAVAEADLEQNGIVWLEPAPLNNTYALAGASGTIEDLGVSTLSDIAALPADEQTFCIESEFSTRDDGWPGLRDAYGFEDSTALLDTGIIYTATAEGTDCTFGEVFETDGRIPAMDLTVLEDDQEFFPAYQGSFTVKQETLDEHPAIADVIGLVSPLLTTEVMQDLNSQVDVDGEDPEDVAIDWLTEQGLI